MTNANSKSPTLSARSRVALAGDIQTLTGLPTYTVGSEQYATSTRLYGLATFPPHPVPAAVITCRSTDDVVASVKAARKLNIPLSVRGGGHNAFGTSLCEGGLTLDLRGMKQVRVDPQTRVSYAGPGATWGDYDAATQEHGLASPGGVVSSTGIAGLTLGGGIGALRGLYGLACDNLKAAEVVLADGSVVRTDFQNEPDLFWGLHGGTSNFGIVTAFEYNVHYVGRTTVTGPVIFPMSQAQEVMANYRRIAPELPDAFATELVFGKNPRGVACLMIMVRFMGDITAAAQALSLVRGCGKFIVDETMEMPYVEAQRWLDPKSPWDSRHYWKTQTLVGMDEKVVATLADLVDRGPSPMSKVVIEHLRGEISRIDPDSTPINFRHAPYNAMVVSEWHDETQDESNRAWAVEAAKALAPFSAGGAYTNYMANDSTEADVRAAFGDAKYARLQAIKKQFDPENFFNRNQNVTPA